MTGAVALPIRIPPCATGEPVVTASRGATSGRSCRSRESADGDADAGREHDHGGDDPADDERLRRAAARRSASRAARAFSCRAQTLLGLRGLGMVTCVLTQDRVDGQAGRREDEQPAGEQEEAEVAGDLLQVVRCG